MKKILILVDKVGPKKELLAELIAKRLSGKNIQIALARFSDLYFEVDSRKISVNIEDMPITDFDLVYFRRAGDKFSGIAATLALCLEEFGIKYIDTTWGNIGPLGSKFTSLVRLARAHIPIFTTVYFWPTHIEKYQNILIRKFGLPLVAKELSTQRGKGVILIKTKEDFKKLPLTDNKGRNNQYLFQKFVKIKDEFRVMVLGDKVRVWESKIITDKKEFRHNVALGANEEFLPIAKIPESIAEIAVAGAKTLNLQIAGVDIAIEKGSEKLFLVEINRGPGITYDTNISPEIDEFAKYLGERVRE
jgi:glutathione synthase/RimK-type ligase-like ATP-grasp enzyme